MIAADPSNQAAGLIDLVRQNLALVVPITFLLGLGKSIPFVSLLIPGTLLFLTIGSLHSAAGGDFATVWLAGSGGAFAGDLGAYALGYWWRDHVASVWPFSRYPYWYARTHSFCRHWGAPGVIGSKFITGLRPLVPLVAGATLMPLLAFTLASALSCLIWAGVYLACGYGVTLLTR